MNKPQLIKKHKNCEIIDGYISNNYYGTKEIIEHITEENENEIYISACIKLEKNQITEKKLQKMIEKQESILTTKLKQIEAKQRKEKREGKTISDLYNIIKTDNSK